MLERLFHLSTRGTTAAREVRGALATFLTMSYILFANPAILSAAGMPREPVIAAIGGFFGASSVTSYVESAAGVSEGARHPLMYVAATAFAADFLLLR